MVCRSAYSNWCTARPQKTQTLVTRRHSHWLDPRNFWPRISTLYLYSKEMAFFMVIDQLSLDLTAELVLTVHFIQLLKTLIWMMTLISKLLSRETSNLQQTWSVSFFNDWIKPKVIFGNLRTSLKSTKKWCEKLSWMTQLLNKLSTRMQLQYEAVQH